jgi:CRISPR-associated protein Cmr5
MMLHSRDQQYAAQVFRQVEKLLGRNRKEQKQYGSMAHKLPVLIRSAGLAQALAFVAATVKRGRDENDVEGTKWTPQGQLLDDLAQMLELEGAEELLTQSRNVSLDEYMFLTQNALAALLWYKRYAQSVLDVEPSDETDDRDDEGNNEDKQQDGAK